MRVPVLAVAGLLLCLQASAVTLFVSPQGRDTWSGKLQAPNGAGTDGPLASLRGARDAIRALKAQGPLTEPVTVRIAKGAYFMSEPLVLGPEDSGTAAAPITYEHAGPDDSFFDGCKLITGLKEGPGGVWVTHLPEVAAGKWYFEQLWSAGGHPVRARTPNVVRLGDTPVPRWLYMRKKLPSGLDPLTGLKADLSRRAFYADPKDLAGLETVPKDRLQDVNVVCYWAWEVSRHRLADVDPQTGAVITTGNAPWAFGWLGMDQRYHLENYRAALDAPGEWYLDRDGTLSYMPFPGEKIDRARLMAPVTDTLIRIEGDAKAGLPVEYVTFRGLRFDYAGHTLPPQGHGDGQADVTLPAVITVDGGRHLNFSDCQVAFVSTYGLWLRKGCRDCRVERCEFRQLGGGGIKIGEPGIAADEADRTAGNVVDNCLIRSGGRLFPGSIGVWIGQSSDNRITHNDISDFFYSGVSVGWSWGYNPTICHNNTIEFNRIHNLGWGVLSDMGGVYTLGEADGTTVSNNVIHDVWSWDHYGWGGLGLYNDEGTSHITMENNLVYDTRDMTYHQHYGRENIVRNNILVNGGSAQLSVHRDEPHLSCTFENNIVYFKQGKLFWQAAPGTRQLQFDRNLYWNTAGEPFDFMGLSFADWQKSGRDAHSLIADPKFADPARLDFTLAPDSPALKLGFKPFDYARAGLYGDPSWVSRAARTYAAVEFAPDPPPPPPLELSEDFEGCAAGAAPGDGQVNLEGKGDSIVVTDEAAAGGKQSLKFTDAEGLQYSFNPHLVYTPDYTEGTGIVSFDVRLEPGAELWHEYRDWSSDPYKVGPSLNIVGGKLRLGEQPLLDLPTGQWVHLEVTCHLGTQAHDRWELAVTLPGAETKRFTDLPVGTPGWSKLTWTGFVSNAKTRSVFYVDNVRFMNK